MQRFATVGSHPGKEQTIVFGRKSIKIIPIACLAIALFCCLFVARVEASTLGNGGSTGDRPLLTVERLQAAIASPVARDGSCTIDLTHLTIDLRPENGEFRDRFYETLQTALNPTGTPLGLDLSDSLIRGPFIARELGLRTPLYGNALAGLFDDREREQLARDRRRLSQLSQLSRSLVSTPLEQAQIAVFRQPLKLVGTHFEGATQFNNTFFLDRLEATGAQFDEEADWSQTRFSEAAIFGGTVFKQEARFRGSIFFEKAKFDSVQFKGVVNFQGVQFEESANFDRAHFFQLGDFGRSHWRGNADFSQSQWDDRALFTRGKFEKSLFLTDIFFNKLASFREARFSQSVNLRGARIMDRLAFSDSIFARGAYINLAGFSFDSEEAKITGDPGQIGRVLAIPNLQGNETLLRQLIHNFRQQEQIADANQIDYMSQSLRDRNLRQKLLGVNVNTASIRKLIEIGFSRSQAEEIDRERQERIFGNLSELLTLKAIDLATYIKVRDRAIAAEALFLGAWLRTALTWCGLSVLLLLSRYGTSFGLAFGVGLVAIAYFSLLFWFVDRYRPHVPKPVIPTRLETAWMAGSFAVLAGMGILAIFRTGQHPWLTLICLATLTIPVPAVLTVALYRQRAHDSMDRSYFVEDGGMRQLRLTIGRLPVIPRFGFFRDRHLPILWDRRWNWLNYYDFSLNNLLKFGFNDIRVRDEYLPGLISGLVWYQWSLGLLYITLLLWTLSRTIPGLNLLIYLK
ncbi:pentapeptide repeat-containing protein [Oxynema sp. CENA135]|uniref:pentapeptide repeat-containing protein n=1 Tax=Oxynema sp. CENA135 TaxID=984206 RepID=UPI001F335ECA|nr:pentapeptide repeat-containing protein [Oxynema sp. CENA135]